MEKPQEEPKQIKCYCGHTSYCDCGPLDETKQETLEEVVNNFKKTDVYINEIKQEQERMYSEEDLKSAFFNGGDMKDIEEFNHWFEQFKKK
ncbi:MAG: hypothetical protein WCO04_01410 [Pseudomonadota bacterium]